MYRVNSKLKSKQTEAFGFEKLEVFGFELNTVTLQVFENEDTGTRVPRFSQ